MKTTTSQVSGSARRQADLGELIRMALRREAKPLDVEELVARLRGLLLRLEHLTPQPDEVLTVGDLELDGASRSVTRAGSSISLTCTEFELLRYLMRRPRRAVSRQEILDRVWNYDFGGRSGIVDLYVSYLRKKVDAGRTPMIHTVRGVGYLLKPAERARPGPAAAIPL